MVWVFVLVMVWFLVWFLFWVLESVCEIRVSISDVTSCICDGFGVGVGLVRGLGIGIWFIRFGVCFWISDRSFGFWF